MKDAVGLNAAIGNDKVNEIIIDGTLGSDNRENGYTIYNVNRPVTIKGAKGAKVFGTFIVKADDVVIENLAIQNAGDLGNGSSNNRGGIYVYAKNVTITDNTFTNGLGEAEGLSNAVQLMSPAADNPLSSYVVTGNKFIGHDNTVPNWSSSGIVIAQGHSPASVGGPAEPIVAVHADYVNLLDNNQFNNNRLDVTHNNVSERIYPYLITELKIDGNSKVGETLTSAMTPADATVTYQWWRRIKDTGAFVKIDGAANSTYTITADDVGFDLVLVVDGNAHYNKTAKTSNYIENISAS